MHVGRGAIGDYLCDFLRYVFKLRAGGANVVPAIDDEEILDKIYEEFINDDSITTVLNNDLQTIINHYLSK